MSEATPYITRGASSDECLDQGLVCSIDPHTGRCTECGELEFPAAYHWTGWESEEDYPPGRMGVYFLTIHTPDGDEYACILHRTEGEAYPLDGPIAKRKEANAQAIVDALNRK